MKKEFITYEQALALKELGFDEECFAFYNGKFLDYKIQGGDICSPYLSTENIGECPNAPTFSQTFRWFREKYGLSGLIEIGTQEFSYQVFNNKGNRQLGTEPLKYNGTYEEAESACLDKLIEIVKNKTNE